MTYAPAMDTAKTARCSWHERCSPVPIGELSFVLLQLTSPPRVRTAMAMKQPTKQISRITAMKAKKVIPPKAQVRTTAKAVYITAAPDMPSTARVHVGMVEFERRERAVWD